MKKIIVISIISVVLGTALGTTLADWIHHSNEKTATKSFLGRIPGITEQDIRLCRNCFDGDGMYYHQFYNVKLTCERKHVSIDYIKPEE